MNEDSANMDTGTTSNQNPVKSDLTSVPVLTTGPNIPATEHAPVTYEYQEIPPPEYFPSRSPDKVYSTVAPSSFVPSIFASYPIREGDLNPAYILFANAYRPYLSNKHPQMNGAEVSRALHKMWTDLPDDDKKVKIEHFQKFLN